MKQELWKRPNTRFCPEAANYSTRVSPGEIERMVERNAEALDKGKILYAKTLKFGPEPKWIPGQPLAHKNPSRYDINKNWNQ